MLRDELNDAKGLRILPSFNYALRQIQKKPGESLSAAEATQAGNSIKAHRVIWGSYDRKNGKWVLTAHILNPTNAAVMAELKSSAADWFDVRDQIVKKILAELAVRPTANERKKMYRRETSSALAFECLARAIAMHREKGSLSESENLIPQAITADTNYARAQLDLGANFANRGEWASAEKPTRRALELQPNYAEAHLDLGILLMLQGKFESAESELLAAARLDPDNCESWNRLGELYKDRDSLDLSAENFNRALRLNPWSAEIHARLGEVYALQGLQDQALAELKQAEPLADPNDVNDQQGLAQAFDTLHEVSSAITHYENLVAAGKRKGANPEALASFKTRLNDLKETLTPIYLSAARPKDFDAAAIAKILNEKLSPSELITVTNPLASNPEMDRWAQDITADATNDLEKAQRLFNTLSRHVDEGSQGWRTAEETFAIWQAPNVSLVCQDYAFLYVALSRHVGLKTYVVFVEQGCDGHTGAHACAALFLGDKVLLVDPMYRWFGAPHKKFTVLNDLQALAVYLACRNNVRVPQIALKLTPDYEQVQFYAAFALIGANQMDAARKVFPADALLHSQGWLWDLLRASFALHDKREDDAIDFLKKAIGQNADCYEAYGTLGEIYARQKKWTEARTNFVLGLEHCPEVTKANYYRAALAEIDETIGPNSADASSPVDAVDYINRGDAHARRNEFDKAIADYSRAIQLSPNSAEAFLRRGYSFVYYEKTDKAVADFQEAIRLEPQKADGYQCLGLFYAHRNEHEAAAKDLQMAVQLGATDPDVYYHLAWIHLAGPKLLRDEVQGLKMARKACILSNWKNSTAMVWLVYAYVVQRDFDSAAEVAKTALSLPDLSEENAKYLRDVIADCKNRTTTRSVPGEAHSSTNLWTTNQPQVVAVISASDLAALKTAARSGDSKAQVLLADCLYNGKGGVAVDRVEAYKWAAVAAAKGDPDATAFVREYDLFMSPAEVASGKAAAAAFLREQSK